MKIPKLKLNPEAAISQLQQTATATAKDRFAVAEEITRNQPNGMASEPAPPANTTARVVPPATSHLPVKHAQAFDLSLCIVGDIVQVPLHLIDLNPLSPRHLYTDDVVDKIASSLPKGQDDAAHGYIQDGRIKLIDGGTRYRAAKITDTPVLDVKIEEPPANQLELYQRAFALNDQRSSITVLDLALSLVDLLRLGVVASQTDLVGKVRGLNGQLLTEATISKLFRIGRMPEKIQRSMAVAPETTTFVALYDVSELFSEGMSDELLETRLETAFEIVDEIKRRKLARPQIQALIKSKLQGPKKRERGSVHQLDFGGQKGQIKLFAKKGKLDLSMQGLSEESLPKVRDALEKTLREFLTAH